MASTRKKSSNQRSKKDDSFVNGFQTEIILLIIFAACVIMMVSVLGMGGTVGVAIRNFLFGTMGVLAYLFPILIFIGFGFILSNRTNIVAYKKLLASIVLFIFLCAFLQLAMEGFSNSTMLADYYDLSAAYYTGGGVIGGAICMTITSWLGLFCSYVIYILVIVICLILITQKSFFSFINKVVQSINESARNRHEQYMERQPERDERRELKKQQRQLQRQRKEAERTRRLREKIEEERILVEDSDDFREEKIAGKQKAKAQSKNKLNRKTKKAEVKKPAFLEGTKLEPRTEDAASNGAEVIEPLTEDQDEEFYDETTDISTLSVDTKETNQGQLEFKIHRSAPAEYVEEPIEESYNEPVNELYVESYEESQEEPFIETTSSQIVSEPQPEEVIPAYAEESFKPVQETSRGISAVQKSVEVSPEPIAEVQEQPAQTRQPSKNPKSSAAEISSGIKNIQHEIEDKDVPEKPYVYPPLNLMKRGDRQAQGDSDEYLKKTAMKLQEVLRTFNVNVTVTNVSCGPTVTRFELQPEMGVKVSKILSLADDIKLNLATPDIRIEAPIPGKAAVGIEVPNKTVSAVVLRDLLESQEFKNAPSKLSFAVGKDIAGKVVVADIAKMPHLLIAGATGSGKSVCINTLIISILYKASPKEVKLIMIDPKVVELSVYNGIPHLLIPVVTDPKKASGALNWAVNEMTSRYNTFAEYHVRNLAEYNKKIDQLPEVEGEKKPEKLPQIVIIVDELADLMMVAPGEVEDAICRLAQLARAAGIHLIIATQRPSVNVITGLIKANMPSRIAFSVSQGVDSRTILDMNGAEKLLGKGDMLFYPQGYQKPARLQGAFVPDEEVSDIAQFLSNKNPIVGHNDEIVKQINSASFGSSAAGGADDYDALFVDAGKFIIQKDKASIGMLQRMFKIGFNRAARIMDQLCDAGVVGPEEGTKPRKVIMVMEEFENFVENM